MISDANRRHLYDRLVPAIGPEASEVLMELLPPAGWTDLATRTDVRALTTDIEIAKTELRIEMQDLRTSVETRLAQMDGRIAGLLPKLIAANVASMGGVAGLILAATSLG
ncbi:MAG: hypothetical protein GY925_29880 [Actinomycetia bacterium]|nr:hypothetical protein [Actinomycetes bacterium]